MEDERNEYMIRVQRLLNENSRAWGSVAKMSAACELLHYSTSNLHLLNPEDKPGFVRAIWIKVTDLDNTISTMRYNEEVGGYGNYDQFDLMNEMSRLRAIINMTVRNLDKISYECDECGSVNLYPNVCRCLPRPRR